MARRPQAADDKIIREAKERFTQCVDWEKTARANAKLDQRFAEGDAYNCWQWDQQVRTDRGNRPTLTHNKVRQHNLMIVNDARQNKAQIKVTPTGDNATYESAQIFAGLIRRIEYQSKAVDAYSTATFHQVQSGIGYVRVDTEYEREDEGFAQEIYIRRVSDWRSIYLDPDAKDYDKADMRFAFVFVDIPRDLFEAEYGEFDQPSPALDNTSDSWVTKEHVRICEYWRREIDEDTLYLMRDGTTLHDSHLEPGQYDKIKGDIHKERKTKASRVEWFKIVGNRVDDRTDWAGKYIPIIPCIGEETFIDGIMDRKGHTRSQIDAQRIYNYWASAAVEQVALQTKIPYLADQRAIDGFEQYWNTANQRAYAYLPYNGVGDDGQQIPPPTRAPPPEMSQAYIQGMMISRQDLLDVTGQYQAELGMPSNERSGVAISQRQRQADTSTYHFVDNQAKMIRQVGRVLLDLIPKIYDTTRVVKIMNVDNSEDNVVVSPQARQGFQQMQMQPNGGAQPLTQEQQDQQDKGEKLKDIVTIFSPRVGRYDVEADVGPSYGTQRQEAANAFSVIMQQNPAAFQIVGDFWARNSDFPGADELADRLQRGIPPQYQAGPSQQEQQLQAQLQATNQAAQQTLKQADAEVSRWQAEAVRLKEHLVDKTQKNLIDDYEAETNRLKAVGQIDPHALQIVVRQLVQDMLQTELTPILHRHAAIQAEIQNTMAPPEQGNGQAPAPPNGGAPQQ